MKKFIKEKNVYLVTLLIMTVMIGIIYYLKGIFPFGDKSIIYSDMQDQIASFYYHMYDAFMNGKSLMIDYTTGGGVNFIGILGYYILSPISLLLLLFKRENIYLAISIVVALKMILSALTCLYSIRYFYKDKIGYLLSIALSILYALSGYTLLLYLITPWMDLVYLFPLLAVGLKKIFNLEKPYFYIIFLTISIICSFYLSYMMLIFIFFISGIYIFTQVSKEKRKKVITSLGISTVISLLLSVVIVYPSLSEILTSSRFGYQLQIVLFSKLGPITDKIEFFLLSPILVSTVILLLINFKNNKKFLTFYLPSLVIVGLPYIIEPINKIVHFMSYASFPNRYGFITFYLLLIGACHYFANNDKKVINIILKKPITLFITYTTLLVIIFMTSKVYLKVQTALFKLTIANDFNTFLMLAILCLVVIIAILIISMLYKNNNKFYQLTILVLTLASTYSGLYLCLGLTSYYDANLNPYKVATELSKLHPTNDIYKVKVNTTSMATNAAMISNYATLDHFTSLTDRNTAHTLKLLGYSSYWTRTSSRGGTLFTDVLLGNKYYLGKGEYNNYLYSKKYDLFSNYKMYALNYDIPYGYFTNNVNILDNDNTFEIQNNIYKSITKKEDNIIDIYDDFKLNNIEIIEEDGYFKYHIIDKDEDSYLEINIANKENSTIYFNLFKSLNNSLDKENYKSLKIYINDELYVEDVPSSTANGTFNLGTYDNDNINIKIVITKDIHIKYIGIGTLNHNKLIDFINDNNHKENIRFNGNKIIIDVTSDESGLYFIPINALEGYKVKLNGENQKIEKAFDNYLGIHLNKGDNHIEFTYTTPGLKEGMIISIITLIILILIYKFNIYNKLINNKILNSIVSKIYILAFVIALICIFIIPILTFTYAIIFL